MFAGKKFGEVMRDFADHFDVIIVDAPPITTSSEASRFTQNISNVVVVAEAVSTRRADLLRVPAHRDGPEPRFWGLCFRRCARPSSRRPPTTRIATTKKGPITETNDPGTARRWIEIKAK